MALTQKGLINLRIFSSLKNPLDLSTPEDIIQVAEKILLDHGSGDNQADEAFGDQRTVAFGATDSLDLSGALFNSFGQSITLTKVKAIYIKAAKANPNDLEVTRPAANGLPFMKTASDALLLKPGGVFLYVAPLAAGVAVTAGTGDLLDMVNPGGAGSCIYDIVILGIE